jgi:hypothetical protein
MPAAMLAPERLQQQSLRHSDPVESCQPPFRIGIADIWIALGGCQAHYRLGEILQPRCPASPRAPGEPSGAGVDAALALDEMIQRLAIRPVRRVAHDPRPLAPSSLVGLGRVGGAPDDSGDRPSQSETFNRRKPEPGELGRSPGLPPPTRPPGRAQRSGRHRSRHGAFESSGCRVSCARRSRHQAFERTN